MTSTYTNRTAPSERRPVTTPTAPLSAIKPPYLMAVCVSLGALILYIATLAPTTQFWDTSEYIAAANTLGIPHPPGNPLFVLMAHVWGLLPLARAYAERINLFAAATSAVSAGCWFLVAERWLRSFVPALWPRRMAALAGAIVSATAFTVWNQSVVNEKVYTLSLLSIALILWLIVRWDDQPAGEAHDHHLLLIIYLLALTATNHMMGVLVGPVVVILRYGPCSPASSTASRRSSTTPRSRPAPVTWGTRPRCIGRSSSTTPSTSAGSSRTTGRTACSACWRWCSRSWAAPARCAIGARTSAPRSP